MYNGNINTQNGVDSFNLSGSLFNSYKQYVYNLVHSNIIDGEAFPAGNNAETQGTTLKKFEVSTIAFTQGMYASPGLQVAFKRYSMEFI